MAVASARSSTLGEVAGSPGLALVLDAGCAPRCLLLHSIATFALMITVLAPLSLPLAVAVLAPLSLPLAVAVLAPLSLAVQQPPSAGSGPFGPPNNNEDPWKQSKWNDKRA